MRGGGTGPHADFDAFFTHHEYPLYAYVRRLLPSDDIAVEIAQEAFFRAWSHFEEIRLYERPEAWLYRVATNLVISALRRRQSVQFSALPARSRMVDEWTVADTDPERGALFTDPMNLEQRTVERDAIAHALLRLDQRERAALMLRAIQGFSHDEIAEVLGISVGNARQILARGRRHFRAIYDADREGEIAN